MAPARRPRRPPHLGDALGPDASRRALVTYRELEGPGALRYLVSAGRHATLTRSAVLHGRVPATRPLDTPSSRARGRSESYFCRPRSSTSSPPAAPTFAISHSTSCAACSSTSRRRGSTPRARPHLHDRGARIRDGAIEVLEAHGDGDAARGRPHSPARRDDVAAPIPTSSRITTCTASTFRSSTDARARLGVPLALGRIGPPGLRQRAGAARHAERRRRRRRRVRFVAPGRELIDTLDAVRRYDFSTRELPGHGLKAVARHLGIAGPDRELHPRRPDLRHLPHAIPIACGATPPPTSTRSRRCRAMLGGAAFALARMAPRRYERLADAGAATGVIDPLLVRAYLRAGMPRCPRTSRATARRTAARRCTSSRRASRIAS